MTAFNYFTKGNLNIKINYQGILPLWQGTPENPGGQLHWMPVSVDTHVPPCSQSNVLQDSESAWPNGYNYLSSMINYKILIARY